MAYIKFCVVAVESDLKEQSIYIHFNKEVDEDTISPQVITVALQDYNIATMAYYDLIVFKDLKTVQIKFLNVPIVNSNYVVLIQNTIKDIEGNILDQSLFRNVMFKSTVTSSIELTSPTNFEIITDKTFTWKEIGSDLINNFRIQISSDTDFNNLIINSTVIGKTTVTFGKELNAGQYYYRVRAEQDTEFGVWSEVRTFLIQADNEYEEEVIGTEDDIVTEDINGDPVIENLVAEERTDLLTVIETSKSGITNPSFSFLFNDNIDTSTTVITITRSDF